MAHELESKEAAARISAEAERRAAAGSGAAALVRSLLAEGADPDLVALAAELLVHAATTRLREEQRLLLAERSPVLAVDARTLLAAPVGPLEREGLERFCDRVLAAAALARPARVLLSLAGFDPHPGAEATFAALAAELRALGAPLERR